jgi:hypothetical protein
MVHQKCKNTDEHHNISDDVQSEYEPDGFNEDKSSENYILANYFYNEEENYEEAKKYYLMAIEKGYSGAIASLKEVKKKLKKKLNNKIY